MDQISESLVGAAARRLLPGPRVLPAALAGLTAMAATTGLAACGGTDRRSASGATTQPPSPAGSAPATGSQQRAGTIDREFGGGMVRLAAGTQLNGAAVQADGKLVVTGATGGADRPRLLVARFTTAGALDATFGKGGLVQPAPSTTSATGEDVAIRRDGRIVVVGRAGRLTGGDGMLVTQLNADGSPDARFGRSGTTVILRGGDRQAAAYAVALRPDGGLVLGGEVSHRAALVVLTRSGALRGRPSLVHDAESSVAALERAPHGRVVFAGTRKADQATLAFVGRAFAGGARDPSFGRRGIVERSYAGAGGAASGFRAVAARADGRVVAAGYAFAGTAGQAGVSGVLARFLPSGRADTRFGEGGVRSTAAARTDSVGIGPPPGFTGLALDRDVVYSGGSWDEVGSSALAAARRTSDGDLDPRFGSGGQLIVPFERYAAPVYGRDVALDTRGLYLVGTIGQDDAVSGVVLRVTTG